MNNSLSHHMSVPLLTWRLELTDHGSSDTRRGVLLAVALVFTGIVVMFLMGIGNPYGLVSGAAILSCSIVVLWRGSERSLRLVRARKATGPTDQIGNLGVAYVMLSMILTSLIALGIIQLIVN